MWVSQTYLANVEPGQGCYVYYLFENYGPQLIQYDEIVTSELKRFGRTHGTDVALFAPDNDSASRVADELQRAFGETWWHLEGKLPGLMVSRTQLADFKIGDEFLYIALGNGAAPLSTAFDRLEVVLNDVRKARRVQDRFPARRNIVDEIWDRISIEPGIAGIKIRLKKPRP